MTGHLIHLGYPKTGSNWLRRWFAGHPQLAYADGGIAGFRDVYQIARQGAALPSGVLYRVTSCEGFATPHANFGLAAMDHDRIQETCMRDAQAEVCGTLAALFPNAHVLLVTRGYLSMLLSSYSQMVRTGAEIDLGAFCRLIEERCPRGHRGESPWDNDSLIGLYAGAFGDGKVIVLPYELLRDSPEAFMRELEGLLGLAHLAEKPDPLNTSLSPEELYWYPRLTRVVRALPVGSRLRQRLFRLYVRGADANRFRRVIRILQRLWPGAPVTAASVPNEMLAALRGRAESLRGNPLYTPHAAEYLWD